MIRTSVRSLLGRASAPSSIPSLARSMHSKPASLLTDPFTVSVIGAPMAYGQPLAGTEVAPAAIRAGGLREVVTNQGWRFEDRGDAVIPTPKSSDPYSALGGKNTYAVGMGNKNVHDLTYSAAKDGHFVLTLGGDHSVAMGSLSGVLRARPELGIVWVDAHADINVPETSPSGNIHGMPLSFLLRMFDPAKVPGCEWLAQDVPQLLASRLVYIGLRDVDYWERKAVKSMGIKAFTMHEVDKYGIAKVMEMTLDHLCGASAANGGKAVERPLHLSYDIDACDPTVAPSTGTTVLGGLNYREAHYVAEECAASGLLGSMDLVEINPKLAPGNGGMQTVTMGLELVASALGKSIL